jgi:hypothetical protein
MTSLDWVSVSIGGIGIFLLFAAVSVFVAERGEDIGYGMTLTTLGIASLELEPGDEYKARQAEKRIVGRDGV